MTRAHRPLTRALRTLIIVRDWVGDLQLFSDSIRGGLIQRGRGGGAGVPL